MVGINPSKGLANGKIFWEYWNAQSGFNHEDWLEDYKSENKKNKKREQSPTRRRIEALRDLLKENEHKLLNCNVFSKNTKRATELSHDDKNLEVFRILTKEIKPKWIIVHGDLPKKVIEKVTNYSTNTRKWEFLELDFGSFKSKVMFIPHLFNVALTTEKNKNRNVPLIWDKMESEIKDM
ncbi:MAG: hypothetical protein ABI378_10170 [Chitinophagaceae bacterium]